MPAAYLGPGVVLEQEGLIDLLDVDPAVLDRLNGAGDLDETARHRPPADHLPDPQLQRQVDLSESGKMAVSAR